MKENILEKYKNDADVLSYAISEFKISGWIDEEGNANNSYCHYIICDVFDLLLLINKQQHLNDTIAHTMLLLNRLVNYMPITDLDGDDSEWRCVEHSPAIKQNKRCAYVFKNPNGFAYDSNGRVFHMKDAPYSFRNLASDKYVKFPYYPPDKPEVVELSNELTKEEIEKYIKEEYRKWTDE